MADPNAGARNAFFQELKPHCIAINNFAVRAADKKASSKDLLHELEELYLLLDRESQSDAATALDHKLADYIFFPLSNVLRNQHEFPIRTIELTVKCLTILIDTGWKSKLPVDLSQQLLILLTFIIGGAPGQETKRPVPEETELEAYRALNALIKASGSSAAGASALVDTKAIPTLGHAVSVILDGVTEGRTPEIQFQGLHATTTLCTSIKDRTALATFLPGIVSALSKLLSPPISPKAQRRVLVHGLQVLRDVLAGVLGDLHVRTILPNAAKLVGDSKQENDTDKVLTPSWLKATSAKVQVALAHVLKLRNHDYDDVRSAVERLSLSLLDECHLSLGNCASILVETSLILSHPDPDSRSHETSLEDLARIYPELCDSIKTVVYNWETSLPRQMQANEEKVRQQAFRNLSRGHHIISNLRINSSVLDNSLAASLRDTAAMALVGAGSGESEPGSGLLRIEDAGEQPREQTTFLPIILPRLQEASIRSAFQSLLKELGSSSQHSQLPETMLSYSRESSGEQRVASFWLAFELLKLRLAHSSSIDEFLDLDSAGESEDDAETVLEELYMFSVAILDSEEDGGEPDWRLQALAIEVATFSASRLKEKFRPELIDVLYPITTFLGSEISLLREHAMTSLNNMATSCGYPSVTDLVVDNVDYMVNSYSLRLNTFDITPASTQVLSTIVQLTGPRLVPYLDDVVASIFGALDNYHGYPVLVEGLFGVLGEIVTQSARSGALVITQDGDRLQEHRKSRKDNIRIEDIRATLATILERRGRRWNDEADNRPHPKQPWKEAQTKTTQQLLDERDNNDEQGLAETEGDNEVEKPPQPQTPTFKILTRITDLTQHYLTSPTPTLRKSLLELLCTVSPTIAADEEAFLPLVNSIWPVTVERLYDLETFVVVSACKALAMLFRCAGDFLSSRVQTEWWEQLSQWFAKRKSDAKQRHATRLKPGADGNKGQDILLTIRSMDDSSTAMKEREQAPSSTPGDFTHAAQVWHAARELLTALLSFVTIDDQIFDNILELVTDDLLSDIGLRNALIAVDADSVWLRLYERGLTQCSRKPEMASGVFIKV